MQCDIAGLRGRRDAFGRTRIAGFREGK